MQQPYDIVSSYSVYRNMRDSKFLKRYYRSKAVELIKGNELYGSSPPDIFVGRYGYPNVYIGPLVPPRVGDTSFMGMPEKWVGKTIPEIVEMRSMLIRGMHLTRINNVDNGRIEEMVKEIALAEKFTEVDVQLSKKPESRISFDEHSQPFGPSAKLASMNLGNVRADRDLESAYLDTDLGASNAIIELYEKGLVVSKIQKALAAGLLGKGGRRKFVPTRWSITATDDTLSKHKLESIKSYPEIDAVRVFENLALDNRWLIIMVPGSWEYESIEAWYPNTTWNLDSTTIDMGASYEPYTGRKTYAEIGGCYYAARLAVSELLEKLKRQAKVLILREVHSGYIMPVGVWNVREHVRQALKREPMVMESLQGVLNYVSKKMDIPVNAWIKNSTLLKHLLYQKSLMSH